MEAYDVYVRVTIIIAVIVGLVWIVTAGIRGTLSRDSAPREIALCEDCGKPATRYAPIIRVSGLDTDITGHRRLSAQTPIYTVVSDTFGGLKVCESCERVRMRNREEKLFAVRAQVSRMNAQIEREISEVEKKV